MAGPPVALTSEQREVVTRTIIEIVQHRRWLVHALNVRTNHIHAVISAANTTPEKVMNDFKAWSTRRLREAHLLAAAQNSGPATGAPHTCTMKPRYSPPSITLPICNSGHIDMTSGTATVRERSRGRRQETITR